MATLVNRDMWWVSATGRQACRVLAQDIARGRCRIRLETGEAVEVRAGELCTTYEPMTPVVYACETVGELRRALRDYPDDTPLSPSLSAFAGEGPRVRVLPHSPLAWTIAEYGQWSPAPEAPHVE